MTEGGIAGRSALVTGASRGIGRAIAAALADAGARVAMIARSRDVLEAAAREVGGLAIVADVSVAADVERLLADVTGFAGGDLPDIVVNAAGAFRLAPVASISPAEFEDQLRVNLLAPFLVIRAVLPGMLARGSGHIVNIGSVAGRHALPGNAAYGASKFGLRGLHEVLAAELRDTGVRATLVEPAATDTPLWDPLNPDSRQDLPSRSQMLRPEEVAAAVRFAVEQPAEVEISGLSIRATGNRG